MPAAVTARAGAALGRAPVGAIAAAAPADAIAVRGGAHDLGASFPRPLVVLVAGQPVVAPDD